MFVSCCLTIHTFTPQSIQAHTTNVFVKFPICNTVQTDGIFHFMHLFVYIVFVWFVDWLILLVYYCDIQRDDEYTYKIKPRHRLKRMVLKQVTVLLLYKKIIQKLFDLVLILIYPCIPVFTVAVWSSSICGSYLLWTNNCLILV